MQENGFKIMRDRKCENGAFDMIVSGPRGVTLQGCGIDRDETLNRLKREITEAENALQWPDDDAIVDAVSGEFEAVQI